MGPSICRLNEAQIETEHVLARSPESGSCDMLHPKSVLLGSLHHLLAPPSHGTETTVLGRGFSGCLKYQDVLAHFGKNYTDLKSRKIVFIIKRK